MSESTVPNPKNPLPWAQLVEAQQQSGLTQKAFCEQQQLSLGQFVYYRSQLTKARVAGAVPAAFAPLQLGLPARSSGAEIRVVSPTGWQCVVPAVLDTSRLKAVLEVLRTC